MKFTIEKTALEHAVAYVARTIPVRPTAPVLAGVVIKAREGRVTLSAFDYETSARTTIPADIDKQGKVLVSGRLLAEIVKALPAKPVTIEADGNTVHVKCGTAKFKLLVMPIDDFPALPATGDVLGVIPGHVLEHAVAQVAIAASRDESLPMLTAIRVEATPGKLTFLSTDRYRLALRELDWTGDVTDDYLIRAKAFTEASKTLTGDVTLSRSGRAVGFTDGERVTTTQFIDGDYPAVRRLFPESTPIAAVVNVAELTAAVKRVSLVAERNTPVRLAFTATEVVVSAGQGDDAQATEAVTCELAGDDITVAFNPVFLLDGLTALGTQDARIGFTHPNKPVLFTGQDTEGSIPHAYQYLLVPIRFAG